VAKVTKSVLKQIEHSKSNPAASGAGGAPGTKGASRPYTGDLLSAG